MTNRKSHGLFVSVPVEELQIKSKDVVFFVYERRGKKSAKLSELRISQGGVVWRGANDVLGRKLSWKQLGLLFDDLGRRKERRRPGEKKSVSRSKRT